MCNRRQQGLWQCPGATSTRLASARQQLAKQLLQTTRKCRLADQLPAPATPSPAGHMCGMWGCLSHCLRLCVWVLLCVCVCCNSYWSMAATPTAVCRGDFVDNVGRLEQTALPVACLPVATCHMPHSACHTPHALRLVKLLILLPATLIFNK